MTAANRRTLVPQGGGDVALGHRCPGEGLTLTMIEVAVRALAGVGFIVPAQDLGYDQTRIPTRPRSGVLVKFRSSRFEPGSVGRVQAGEAG